MTKDNIAGKIRFVLVLARILTPFLLSFGIFVCLEIISFNHNTAFDLTPEKKYTLSDQAKQVLDSLVDTVQLKTFYAPGERKAYEIFYEKLAAYSGKIDYELIDLDRNPGKARMLNASSPGHTIVEYKGKTRIINPPTEETVVNALLRLSGDHQKFFYILKGHGATDDFSVLKDILGHENWQVREVYLSDMADTPHEHNAVLMLAGLENDLSTNETQALKRYLDSGGKAVVLLEPFAKISNLKSFLENMGLVLPEEIIIDQKNKLFGGDYLAPLIPYYAKAPVTSQVSMSSIFSTARPVGIKRAGNPKGPSIVAIASSESHSWAKSNREDVMKGRIEFVEGADRPGPIPVAAMVTMPQGGGKQASKGWELICFGDSDFIKDSFFEIMGNQDFFLNSVEWLARDYDLISIRQKRFRYPYQFLSDRQGNILFHVLVIFLPSLFLLTGITIFFYRRANG